MTAAVPTRTHVIHFTLDDEPQDTTETVLTPRQIMEGAKPARIDPGTHYLVQIEGQHQTSYKDKADEPIHMHEKMRFVSVSTRPTPVS